MHGDGSWSPSHDHVPVEEHRLQDSNVLAGLSIIQSMHSAAAAAAAAAKGMKPYLHADSMTTMPAAYAYPLVKSALCQYLPPGHATKGGAERAPG